MPDALTDVFERIGGGPRIMAVLIGVGALAVVWGFSRWGMAPTYVPIATGLPMAQIGQATQQLDQAGISYRLERGGSVIAVDEKSAGKARVTLASAGLTGEKTDPGFELFDQPSWGMTDFTQRVNYRRALEGSLERTIRSMRGVENAEVHITLQESDFLDSSKRPPQASVVLDRSPSSVTDDGIVQGIQALVASSVGGMTPDHVTVLDDRGRLLSSPEGDEGVGLSNRQLKVQRQVETYLQSKAQALVAQMVGNGNAQVRVAAELNFDQIDRTVQGVDPDQQVLISQDRAEITPAQKNQGASSVTTNDVYQNTHSTETLSRGGSRLERLTVAVVLADKEVKGPGGKLITQPRTPAEINQVEAVVRNAVGFSAKRGDKISVVSVPFPPKPPAPAPEPGPGLAGTLLAYQRPIVAVAGLIVALVLGMKVLSAVTAATGSSPERRPAVLAARPREEEIPAPRDAPQLPASAPAVAAAQAAPSTPQVTDPGMTARVVRAWMKES